MNWGYKVMMVFIAFGLFMGFLVYSCMKTPVSLVSAEYYKDELNYQQVIEGAQRANGLASKAAVSVQHDRVLLQLPARDSGQLKGKVLFYCVNDMRHDRRLALETSSAGQQEFPLSLFSAGRYIVKMDWSVNGENYYTEQEIVIP